MGCWCEVGAQCPHPGGALCGLCGCGCALRRAGVPSSANGRRPNVGSEGGGLAAAVQNSSTRMGPTAVMARTQSSAAVSPVVEPARPSTLLGSACPAVHSVVGFVPPVNSTRDWCCISQVMMPRVNAANFVAALSLEMSTVQMFSKDCEACALRPAFWFARRAGSSEVSLPETTAVDMFHACAAAPPSDASPPSISTVAADSAMGLPTIAL